ncbi:tripartite motif-containing protein 16-like protein [Sinocyclocheilus rhinocerous]|uniref:tripartite motif-containing protein 16-like protein n=1 Tax=Sinocyclocheilus rhinocerous TaxID=307959 RepID=UPI0007B9D0C3|nr:PREDICTED: tripartite motif-containing protein 16-like protein [Sinocyclocheilus rhinocerous]
MAEASISWAEDQFCCPVCLDLLKDPVTIPCGHSYCMRCITDYWDQEDWKGIYRCPQCRKTFTPRPVLGKNVVFAEMVEKLKTMRLQSTPVPATPAAPVVHRTGSGDVQCDSCTVNKQKAVKSCLECRSSYCQNHLEQHENLFRGNKHNLMDATGRLQDMMCPQHGKMLEIYCHTDQRCICMLCLVDEHKHHDTVSTGVARAEKQRHFEETQRNIQKTIQQRKIDLKQMREAMESHKHSAQTAVEDSERIFTDLIRSIEKRRTEVKQLIRDQEQAAVKQAEQRLARLELEIDDLRWKGTELKQLSNTDDHIHFLQSCPSVSLSGSTDSFTVSSRPNFDEVVKSVSQLRNKLQQFCTDEIERLSKTVKTVQVIVPSHQLTTRKEFLQYSRLLTLDLNSVNYGLRLFEENTVITYSDTRLPYPDHPDRFDSWTMALCRESVTGRCYWEVEWAGDGGSGVDIGVTYKSISRKGNGPESAVGRNNQSWSLFCSPDYCSFWHSNIETKLSAVSSSRIGVYVDHSAGILSFYSVSDTMSLIQRVQTTFTQPLYAVFGFDRQTAVKLSRRLNNPDVLHILNPDILQAFLLRRMMMS